MRTRKSFGITKQHGEHLREVIAWLSVQDGTTPLEIGVLEEITQRVEHRALAGSLLRVRLKNRPHQSNPQRAVSGPLPERRDWREWSVPEMESLRAMFRENTPVDEIAERLGRSPGSVDHEIGRLGLWGTRTHPLPRSVRYNSNGALTRAKEAYAARKRREMERL
jgi:hypothetical protein